MHEANVVANGITSAFIADDKILKSVGGSGARKTMRSYLA